MFTNSEAYEKISPTAKLVAYLRTFSDIPYSSEIAALCKAREAFELIVGDAFEDFLQIAPMNEMRYKAVEVVLNKYACRGNVIELASGVSPRGLIRSRDVTCSYLETDLPGVLAEKTMIAPSVLRGSPMNRLQFLSVNAVDTDQFFKMEHFVGEGSVSIISEGLIMYLSAVEREKLARNVYQFLKTRGGIWIIPDLSLNEGNKKIADDRRIRQIMHTLSTFTAREVGLKSRNPNEPPLLFLERAGFKAASVFKQRELVPDLVSINAVLSDPESIEDMLAPARVVVLEVPPPI